MEKTLRKILTTFVKPKIEKLTFRTVYKSKGGNVLSNMFLPFSKCGFIRVGIFYKIPKNKSVSSDT